MNLPLHIGKPSEKKAVEIMHCPIDEGITFFDNSWDYHGKVKCEWAKHSLEENVVKYGQD